MAKTKKIDLETFNYDEHWFKLMGLEWVPHDESQPNFYSSVNITTIRVFTQTYLESFEGYSQHALKYEPFKYTSLRQTLRDFYSAQLGSLPAEAYPYVVDALLSFTMPAISENSKDPAMVAIFQTKEKRDKDIRTPMKLGKLMKLFFPTVEDHFIEKVVNDWKEMNTELEYEVIEGKTREEFKKIYTMGCAISNSPQCYGDKKLLKESCMRYPFESLNHHPVEAYASGEFAVIGIIPKGKTDRLSARTIVHLPTNSYGPIYVTTDHSYDALKAILVEKGYHSASDEEWIGAKLLIIRNGGYNTNKIVVPYIDLRDCRAADPVDKEFMELVQTDEGSIELDTASGYTELGLGGGYIRCSSCEIRIDRDDAYYGNLCSVCAHDEEYVEEDY